MSPGDSAFASGVPSNAPSGVQTKAHSDVAAGDLEQFDSEEGGQASFGYPEQQQARGECGRGSRVQLHNYVCINVYLYVYVYTVCYIVHL